MIKKLLVANRSEIAIRIMRAATELNIRTVGIYADEDRLSLHRYKADESYLIGQGLGPVKAYLSIDDIIQTALDVGCEAIHPGYGFLSENPEFAEACVKAGLIFVGPDAATMRKLGNKVSAREVALKAGAPVMPASGPLPRNDEEIKAIAEQIGYPLMLKASWGGGGRGMRRIEDETQLLAQVNAGRVEAEAAFGNGEVYLEKLVVNARHVEVQLLGDKHGNVVHLFERDCTVQRRNQKVVERAPAPYLDDRQRNELCDSALRIAQAVNYENAGTAEFLMDRDSGAFYFIEVNPRVQVEHTVTEEVTGIDIVKAQIRIAQGGKIGDLASSGVPCQENIRLNGHALQCRITTEDPQANFVPDYGRITAYRGATGFGVRLDGGTAYSGAVITRYYDSLLEKITCWAPTPTEAISRMVRALREFRIRGLATNLPFVEHLINHPKFVDADYNTRFIDETRELFSFSKRQDRATLLLNFIANVMVNGNPEVKGRKKPEYFATPRVPHFSVSDVPKGSKDILNALGPEGFSQWLKEQKRVLVTDTTMRDAHQSLLATRMRTFDIAAIAPAYGRLMPELLSLECWGGATFDVSMRFLKECPWSRLAVIRERAPNILLQMLLRGSNGVGYTNYPDNVVKRFVKQAADKGIDLFRVFDSLNWVENMRVSMDAVLDSGKLLEGAICYTGDMFDPARSTYNLSYYLKMAKDLKKAGCHIIGIKDMAGLLKPDAARVLVRAIKDETGLPVHFHTHDTSGISAATVIAAVEAGVDAIDAAVDSFSGGTSQPNMGSIVEALKHHERSPELSVEVIRQFSEYWEVVRNHYSAFESDMKSGASEVYLHEMPGGQFTNLKEQARSLNLSSRWHEVAKAYADVNQMFGDIVKVTPSSKVVGDMALMMVSANLSKDDVENPQKEISFPESVVSFFKGEIGQPPNGFNKALQQKVLKGQKPLNDRPGLGLPVVDFVQEQKQAEEKVGRRISADELDSYLMYPKVFVEFAKHKQEYGEVEVLPTPLFFYGMEANEEVGITIEKGKSLNLRCLGMSEPNEEAVVRVFFELNGQSRIVRVIDQSLQSTVPVHVKADKANEKQVGSPMPGMISSIFVKEGDTVKAGQALLSLEAMKMETSIHAEVDGVVSRILLKVGTQVDAKDLLIEMT